MSAPCGHQTRNGDVVLVCCYGAGHPGAHEHETAPTAEPIAETRIEWGHVWADPERQRRWLIENNGDPVLRLCDPRDVRSGPCELRVSIGHPIDHVWRRVVVTTWQEGQP